MGGTKASGRRAIDPGPEGNYPYFPRDEDGNPLWAPASAIVNGRPVAGMPTDRRTIRHRINGRIQRLVIDLTPRDAEGNPIDPPIIPPGS